MGNKRKDMVHKTPKKMAKKGGVSGGPAVPKGNCHARDWELERKAWKDKKGEELH